MRNQTKYTHKALSHLSSHPKCLQIIIEPTSISSSSSCYHGSTMAVNEKFPAPVSSSAEKFVAGPRPIFSQMVNNVYRKASEIFIISFWRWNNIENSNIISCAFVSMALLRSSIAAVSVNGDLPSIKAVKVAGGRGGVLQLRYVL